MSDRENALHSADGGLDIGPMLEQARKDRGLSLAEVEQATKIRKRYLQGLERDDYGALPDAIYARGFLKTYANFLGLDGERLAGQLKSRRAPRRERHGSGGGAPGTRRPADFDRPLISPGGLGGAERRMVSGATVMALLVGLLALSAVIGTLYYIGLGSQTGIDEPARQAQNGGSPSGDEPQESGGENPSGGAEEENAAEEGAPPPDEEEPQGGDSEEPAPEVLTAVVTVEGAPSWLQILADGEVALEQVAEPGFRQTFEADKRLTIYTGNAGAVSVTINGQDVGPLGENGEVLTRDWKLKDST